MRPFAGLGAGENATRLVLVLLLSTTTSGCDLCELDLHGFGGTIEIVELDLVTE
ncbi:hypothetical protein HMPREF1531_01510 [Propionibacterium sp. oral taxon 192 str. F0372]|nr:hypothetical protein HMPREF1531_01510 [Propionibacterium sp. oral taxon 192 str. F0372]